MYLIKILILIISKVSIHYFSIHKLDNIYAVKALGEIATTLGIKRLNLSDGDPCLLKTLKLGVVSNPDSDVENIILCDCSFDNNMTCHITEL